MNTIVVKGFGRYEEGRAAGAIKPGQLIDIGTAGTFTAHATQGGKAVLAVAIESALNGKSIDDAFASGDVVPYMIPAPGDEMYVYIDAGETIVVGTLLQSAGNGNFEAVTSTNHVFLEALEAVDLSASGAVATRIKARAL